jgi:predicted phosphate transport protein (TIGR00153 family)
VRLLPRAEEFFALFVAVAQRNKEAAQHLYELFEAAPDRRRPIVDAIKRLEHEADQITHEVVNRLDRTFITPLDREDIHEFVCRLDDIVDRIDTAVDRVCLFKFDRPMEEARQLARCLERSTALIQEMIPLLRKMRSPEEVRVRVREVHRLESEADGIERQALVRLFENQPDPIHVIKWKNIIEVLESATDKCEDVSNVIEGIVLKNG